MEHMSACTHVRTLTTPFVDGELDPATRDRVDAHLASCPACRALVDQERAARTLLTARRERLREAAPPRLHARIAGLARAERARAGRARRVAGALPLAASLLLAVGGMLVYGLLGSGGRALAGQLALDHYKCVHIVGGAAATTTVDGAAARWERDHGWAVRLPASDDRFRFVALRHCLHSHGLMAHALYRRGGELVSLFIIPRPVDKPGVQEIMGERAAIWSTGGRTYAVVGAAPPADLDAFAAAARTSAR
jgi:anti-sigma factor RsiW